MRIEITLLKLLEIFAFSFNYYFAVWNFIKLFHLLAVV